MTQEDLAADSKYWTFITVTFNSACELRDYWARSEFGSARRIVVDNASDDESASIAQGADAEVIRLANNVGFARANNVALAEVTSPWVVFVNPDVTVDSPAGLERLAAVSTANGNALVAPQLINPDGTEQANARGLPYLVNKIAHRGIRLPGARLDDYARTGLTSPTFVAWVMGAALAGPTEVFRRLGGWDERFFVYYEDHDIGLRAWEAGTSVIVDPAVKWMHRWQRATARLSVTPWKHEIRSARVFYSGHPALIWRSPRVGRPHAALMGSLPVWSAARDAT